MITAILQARTSSSRLPGKVMKPILGKPMLELHLERLMRAKKIGWANYYTSGGGLPLRVSHRYTRFHAALRHARLALFLLCSSLKYKED